MRMQRSGEDREIARRRGQAKTKSQFVAELEEIPNFEVNGFGWFQVVIDGVSMGQLAAMTPCGDQDTMEVLFAYNEYTDMTNLSFNIFLCQHERAFEYLIVHRNRISVWKQKTAMANTNDKGNEA